MNYVIAHDSRNGQNFIRKVSANCMQWLSDMKGGGGAAKV